MLVGAAVCPHPPLLVPAVGAGTPAVEDVRAAAAAAVRALLATRPEHVVVVGSGPGTASFGPDAWGSFAGYGVEAAAGLGPPEDRQGPPRLPLALAVGADLLARAGWRGEASGLAVRSEAPSAEARELGSALRRPARPTALLVMGDGSVRRGNQGPGAFDERAPSFDRKVTAALQAGDCSELLALDAALAQELLVAGRAAWQVLAGAAAPHVAGWQRRVSYDGAPFGVGYVVATWLVPLTPPRVPQTAAGIEMPTPPRVSAP
ncbi:MAG: hypothetical protein M3P96_07080 [Actinomycetota bacterium]|nr:hypothetical protein [Actinomycetota bacterium]